MDLLQSRLEDLRAKLNTINDENDAYWGEKFHSAAARESYRRRVERLAWLRKEITEMQDRLALTPAH